MGLVGGGQAIRRWEGNHNQPRPRQRAALLATIDALNPAVATQLAAAFGSTSGAAREAANGATTGKRPSRAPSEAATLAVAQQTADTALELALLRMADELDVPARRLRASALHFLDAIRAARLGIDEVHARVAAWTARTE